jgi:hypothetical protein
VVGPAVVVHCCSQAAVQVSVTPASVQVLELQVFVELALQLIVAVLHVVVQSSPVS